MRRRPDTGCSATLRSTDRSRSVAIPEAFRVPAHLGQYVSTLSVWAADCTADFIFAAQTGSRTDASPPAPQQGTSISRTVPRRRGARARRKCLPARSAQGIKRHLESMEMVPSPSVSDSPCNGTQEMPFAASQRWSWGETVASSVTPRRFMASFSFSAMEQAFACRPRSASSAPVSATISPRPFWRHRRPRAMAVFGHAEQNCAGRRTLVPCCAHFV